MVWLGPPARGAFRPRLHDAPYPGFKLPEPEPKISLNEQRRRLHRDSVLVRVGTIVLIVTAAAFLVLVFLLVVAHI
jgi:hypothetical protein